MCSDTTRPREPIGDQLTTDRLSDVEERLYRPLRDAVSRNDAADEWFKVDGKVNDPHKTASA